MDLWILATLAAALLQTLRFGLQKHLKQAGLSPVGATWARFLWAWPVLAMVLAIWMVTRGAQLPALTFRFWVFLLAGGLGQVLATICVVALFSRRNFAVGLTIKKSETLQTALVGWLVLGEALSGVGFVGVCLGLFALLVLVDPSEFDDSTNGLRRLLSPSLGLGLLSGAFFAVAAVGYRAAMLELGDGPVGFRALVALTLVTMSQTAIMGIWFLWRDRSEIGKVFAAWRPGIAVGLSGLAGSLCWFVAFALQNAAYVHAVGQVEVLFGMAGGALFFGERLSGREKIGVLMLTVSIIVIVLAT